MILHYKVNIYRLPDLPDDFDDPELFEPLLRLELERDDEELVPLLRDVEDCVDGLLIRVPLERDPEL